jgi:hypothetical protein
MKRLFIILVVVLNLSAMKKHIPFSFAIGCIFVLLVTSCSRPKYYASTNFMRLTENHKLIAVLPAEIIFTGKQPKNMTPESIAAMEEQESLGFARSLASGILRNANSRYYYLFINVQDVYTTRKMLEEHNISIRQSWTYDDKELAKILGVDAVVRMHVQLKRYMSDMASYGVGVGRQVLSEIGANNGFSVPYIPNKTNDVYASYDILCNNMTIWNDHYRSTANWNYTSDVIMDNITDNFGRYFPYKRRREY